MPRCELDEPKYEVEGKLERVDEGDTVFTRSFMVPDSEAWQKYFKKHPDLEKQARRWAQLRTNEQRRLRIPHLDELMGTAMRFVISAMTINEYVVGKPAPEKITIDPKRASEKIKGFASQLGADLVKIGPLNPAWTYSHVVERQRFTRSPVNISHGHAITVAIAYNQDDIECAPRYVVGLATLAIYHRLSAIVVSLAEYIRSLGYNARAHNFNGQVLMVPVAIDAGFGELGRNGIMITEEYGSAVKPMCVTTDMPLTHDKPVDIGVDGFCRQCTICAEICPAGAISRGDKKVVRGVKKWPIKGSACLEYFLRSGGNCSLCIAYCPWTVERSSKARENAIKGDAVLPREKRRKTPSWMEEQPEIWREVMRTNHPFNR